MAEQQNVDTVRKAYEAFGRGDVPAMLASMSDDVDWLAVYGTDGKIPLGGRRTGHAQVGDFFQKLGEQVEFSRFEPKQFIADGDDVIVLGTYAARVRATGRAYASDWVMHFRFRDGKVAQFREYADSAAVIAAFAA